MGRELREDKSPVTSILIGFVIGAFLVEVWYAHRFGLDRVEHFATGLFPTFPGLAWAASPIMHRDQAHLLSSIFGLVLLGTAVERHWPRLRYVAFLVVTGYVSTAVGGLVLYAFAGGNVAVYGASGIAYAMSGFGIAHLLWSHVRLTHAEWLAVLMGVVALVQVVLDVVAGPYFTSHWFNGGHMAGFVIGTVAGRYGLNDCELRY